MCQALLLLQVESDTTVYRTEGAAGLGKGALFLAVGKCWWELVLLFPTDSGEQESRRAGGHEVLDR